MSRRFDHALVIGKFYPFHVGHASLVRAALRESRDVSVQVLGSSVESVGLDERIAWMREEHPTARIDGVIDDAPVDYGSEDAWQAHVAVIQDLLDPALPPVDAVFTSDEYGAELARRLGATWRQIDAGRRASPVSGTAIRADLAERWHELPSAVRAGLIARVVVLGAESTGSTTLAQALADELCTVWVPEYGREYSLVRDGGLDAPWQTHEFDLIIDRQIRDEESTARRAPRPVLVCDTDVLATVLWHERYVGGMPERLVRRAREHPPVVYVLTGDDIPFVQDGTRDGEHIRHAMQQRFRDALAAQPVPWIEVTGGVAERVAQSLPVIVRAVENAQRFAVPLEARPRAEQEAIHRAGRTGAAPPAA